MIHQLIRHIHGHDTMAFFYVLFISVANKLLEKILLYDNLTVTPNFFLLQLL